jgi:hypothetical protein
VWRHPLQWMLGDEIPIYVRASAWSELARIFAD